MKIVTKQEAKNILLDKDYDFVDEQMKTLEFCLNGGKYTLSRLFLEAILRATYSQGVSDGMTRIIEIHNGVYNDEEQYQPDEKQAEIEAANQNLV